MPWRGADVDSSSWSAAVAYLVTVVGTKQATLQAPEGSTTRDVVRWTDQAVADFIDDWCGTRPWPRHGPHPHTAALLAGLTFTANTLHAGPIREELLHVAGRIVQGVTEAAAKRNGALPTPEEIESMAVFSSQDDQCDSLCRDLQRTAEDFQEATTPADRKMLAARINSINQQMRSLHCKKCLPR